MRSFRTKIILYLLLSVSLLFFHCNQTPERTNSDFCQGIHRQDNVSLGNELEGLDSLLLHHTGVYVLEDGDGAMISRAWLSEYAENTIDIQYFIFSTDNVGLIACDYLVRAADRGVKVRILVDDIMVDAGIKDVLCLDAHKNIEIKIYNPGVNLGKNVVTKLAHFATDFAQSNKRMHNKTFTVDGTIAITGGRNIADEYFDYDHEYNFRDRDILLLGKGVHAIEHSFELFWNHYLSVPISKIASEEDRIHNDSVNYTALHEYACNPENFWPQVRERIINLPAVFHRLLHSGEIVWTDSVLFISDMPGKNDGLRVLHGGGITTDALFSIARSATKTIDIQSPYLITTPASIALIKSLVDRGVQIRILTNSLASTDNVEAFNGYQRNREAILKTGARIFEFRPNAAERFKMMTGSLQQKLNYTPIFGLHAKSMVIDGKTAVIGTFNFDPRSANLNTECLVVVHSYQVAQGVLSGMEIEFKAENAWETTLKWNPDREVDLSKRLKAKSRRIIPQSIL